NTEKWDEHRLTTWFDVFLPTLNLEKQEVTEMLSDSALYWLKTYDIDGFRHDATKHIPKIFWRTLTKKVRKYEQKRGEPVFQIGETYGTPELINSYLGTGMLDGQFDFNVYDALLSSICRKDVGFEVVQQRLSQSFDYYGQHNLMGYMTGNQDKPRFMAMATGDVKFDEDAKYAGWSRNIQKKTDTGYKKLAMMHAILQTIPGIPVSYYGDEIGLTGGNDPDNRRDMKFDKLTQKEAGLRKKVGELTKLRRSHLAFLYGDFNFLENKGDFLAYTRQFFHSFGLVIVNNSDQEKKFTFDLPQGLNKQQLQALNRTKFEKNGGKIVITLPPYSFEIIHTAH
ncbi:MAG TPA: alpha-amlyase, partial [Saprospiraceae bacterium]|nr:alpha-amlyase [Saprospiraceae bacterium]